MQQTSHATPECGYRRLAINILLRAILDVQRKGPYDKGDKPDRVAANALAWINERNGLCHTLCDLLHADHWMLRERANDINDQYLATKKAA